MTSHAVITYFDERTRKLGYVLGVDSKETWIFTGENDQVNKLERDVDKFFISNDTIGLMRGNFGIEINPPETVMQRYKTFRERLSMAIDIMNPAIGFSGIVPFLESLSGYGVILGRMEEESLALYEISDQGNPEDHHRLKEVHRIVPSSNKTELTSVAWSASEGWQLTRMDHPNQLDLNSAGILLERMLRFPPQALAGEYNPGEPKMFAVTFEGIGQLAPKY